MKCNWTTKKLSEIAYINPRESLGNGKSKQREILGAELCRTVPIGKAN